MSLNDIETNTNGQTVDATSEDGLRKLYQNAADAKKNLKALNRERTGLLSPDASEEPDPERIKANKERIEQEAKAAEEARKKISETRKKISEASEPMRTRLIKRIMSCPDTAYDEILGIKPGTKNVEMERDKNFVLFGCLLHPAWAKAPQLTEAYLSKLETGTKSVGC